ncbi:RsmB/NOP family class I SAM-dependent RNA methyltransferase [Roseomonas elaeocarpi]|uniref:RsmB/NOP family class I SAM-dependent RNA methyltransferase n=1 Tax=Roseomonas elaeocarpi TaxID=907779 RepID=A0ABV6JSE5_9PROT
MRQGAAALIEAVLERRRPLEEALDALPAMEARDRAAAHRIASAVLRRLGSIDAVLEPLLRREPPDIARAAMRIGVAELLVLGTPAHAAVSAAVALVPQPLRGLVNAVLRRVAAEGAEAIEALDGERLDTPGWLWGSWHAAYGPAVRAIARAHRLPAPLDLSLLPGAAVPEGGVLLPTGTVRLPAGTRFTDLAGAGEARFWAQDAAAALPARLLAARAGERVADIGAAPGGKTAQLASAGARVTSVEKDARRAERLQANLARLGLEAEIAVTDATAWRPAEPFDAILLDAPCSATGTMRRHPDVPFLKRPTDVASLVALQRPLIQAAAAALRPGGRLVFATCSLQPEEGEGQVGFAASLGLRPDPVTPDELPGLAEALTPEGHVRTRPDLWAEHGGLDGFFVARFRKPE